MMTIGSSRSLSAFDSSTERVYTRRSKPKAVSVLSLCDELPGLIVEALWMGAIYIGGVDSQRAVDKDRQTGDFALFDHDMQVVDQVLGASHGEGGDDDLAAPFDGAQDHFAQLVVGFLRVAVRFVAVGAFHEQVIGPAGQHRVAQQGQPTPADIAGEPQAVLAGAVAILLFDIQHHSCRAQDMPGVFEMGNYPGSDFELLLVMRLALKYGATLAASSMV